jgi:hypothetical protein
LLPLLERLTTDYLRHECFTEPWEESFENEIAEAVESV